MARDFPKEINAHTHRFFFLNNNNIHLKLKGILKGGKKGRNSKRRRVVTLMLLSCFPSRHHRFNHVYFVSCFAPFVMCGFPFQGPRIARNVFIKFSSVCLTNSLFAGGNPYLYTGVLACHFWFFLLIFCYFSVLFFSFLSVISRLCIDWKTNNRQLQMLSTTGQPYQCEGGLSLS